MFEGCNWSSTCLLFGTGPIRTVGVFISSNGGVKYADRDLNYAKTVSLVSLASVRLLSFKSLLRVLLLTDLLAAGMRGPGFEPGP